jgi:hypothetical protein
MSASAGSAASRVAEGQSPAMQEVRGRSVQESEDYAEHEERGCGKYFPTLQYVIYILAS